MSTKSICRSNVLLVHTPFSLYLLPSTLLLLPLFQILFLRCCPFPFPKHPSHHTAHFHSICINRQYYQVLLVLLLGSVIISSENILPFLPGRETGYPTFRVTAVLRARTHCKCVAWRLAV